MKAQSLVLLITLFLSTSFSNAQRNSAIVAKQQEVFIFILSKPTSEYETLGTINKTVVCPSQKTISSYIEEAKAQYPKANGIIFSSISLSSGEIVFIKKEKKPETTTNNTVNSETREITNSSNSSNSDIATPTPVKVIMKNGVPDLSGSWEGNYKDNSDWGKVKKMYMTLRKSGENYILSLEGKKKLDNAFCNYEKGCLTNSNIALFCYDENTQTLLCQIAECTLIKIR